MKVHLLYRDKDFDFDKKITPLEQVMAKDLELNTLLEAMAGGDRFLLDIARKVVFSKLDNLDDILYRQGIVKDCIKNPHVIRTLFALVNETLERKREHWWGITSIYLSSVMSSSISLLQMLVDMLKKLRSIVDAYSVYFSSAGFTTLFSMLQKELDDDYFSAVEEHLSELKFKDGIMISAELGSWNQGVKYVLRRQNNIKHRWWKWNLAPSFSISPRDDSGCTDLSKRKDRAINLATNALAQSAEHVLSFFIVLQQELAYYVGCLNLYDKLTEKGVQVSFPKPCDRAERKFSASGLRDVSLSLIMSGTVVGNAVNADDRQLVIITGANQGGKSTFLRSVGQAQVMMQSGLFVAAESLTAGICSGIFTHFKKEEDALMKSGKLDEELVRMNAIADNIKPYALILFNESFSATNEREGSEIGRQIVRALLEKNIKVFFVSHLYDFVHGFYVRNLPDTVFLRAERQPDGRRTYKLTEGEPLATSFGEDIYNKIFGRP